MNAVHSRVPKYVPWGIAVAGALLHAAVASSQTPESSQAGSAVKSEEYVSPQLRKVRHALANDPVLSHCALEAKLGRSELEVAGVVPDEAAHKRALKLIHANTSLPILDMLKVQLISNPHIVQSPYHPLVQQPASGELPTKIESTLTRTPARTAVEVKSHVVQMKPAQLPRPGLVTTPPLPPPASSPDSDIWKPSNESRRPEVVPVVAAVEAKLPTVELAKPEGLMSEDGYESTGVVILAQALDVNVPARVTPTATQPEAKPKQPARLTPQPETAPAMEGAYDTTGVITFTSPAVANALNTKEMPLSKLRASIVDACGRSATSVILRSRGSNKLLVEMNVQHEADAHELGPKLFALAELIPYEVELNIRVAK